MLKGTKGATFDRWRFYPSFYQQWFSSRFLRRGGYLNGQVTILSSSIVSGADKKYGNYIRPVSYSKHETADINHLHNMVSSFNANALQFVISCNVNDGFYLSRWQ